MFLIRLITVPIIFLIAGIGGCTNSPDTVARFFLESQLKGNDENARSLVVSSQQDLYSGTSGGFSSILSEELGYDEPTPEADEVARILAKNLVISVLEKSDKTAKVEYRFDTDKIRDAFNKQRFMNSNLVQTGLREAALQQLKRVKGKMILVQEDGEWKIDLAKSVL